MRDWIHDVAIRTIKTMAQTALGVIGSSALISEVNWQVVLSSVVLAGVCCILMNISQIKED